MNEKYRAICEENGWTVCESADSIELYQYSPAGEDFSIILCCPPDDDEQFLDEIRECYEAFDPEEHVIELIDAKRAGLRGVPNLKTLVVDADKIEEMIRQLVVALGCYAKIGCTF